MGVAADEEVLAVAVLIGAVSGAVTGATRTYQQQQTCIMLEAGCHGCSGTGCMS